LDFSVIIPVLNERDHIARCLASLARQKLDRERFEILVVDNGSTDGTRELLAHHPDIRVLDEPKRDPYAARNRGIDAATGRVLAFTDGDCAVDDDWLLRFERAFADGAEIAIGRLAYPECASVWVDRYADYYDAKTRWLFEQPGHEGLYGHAGNMAVSARVFERIGRFAELPLAGDTELLHRAPAAGEAPEVRYLDDAVATHLEVERLRDLLPKLVLYGEYSVAVGRSTRYRVLSVGERLRIALRCVRENRYRPLRVLALAVVLALGAWSFQFGRLRGALEQRAAS